MPAPSKEAHLFYLMTCYTPPPPAVSPGEGASLSLSGTRTLASGTRTPSRLHGTRKAPQTPGPFTHGFPRPLGHHLAPPRLAVLSPLPPTPSAPTSRAPALGEEPWTPASSSPPSSRGTRGRREGLTLPLCPWAAPARLPAPPRNPFPRSTPACNRTLPCLQRPEVATPPAPVPRNVPCMAGPRPVPVPSVNSQKPHSLTLPLGLPAPENPNM